MKRIFVVIAVTAAFLNCGRDKMRVWQLVDLPSGFGNSHILSIDIKDDRLLVGTYGRGALLGDSSLANWTVFDITKGLSWDFILGGDWDGDYIILATLGDGVNISEDGGRTWKRYGFNFFGIEYLYAVDAIISAGRKYIPT